MSWRALAVIGSGRKDDAHMNRVSTKHSACQANLTTSISESLPVVVIPWIAVPRILIP